MIRAVLTAALHQARVDLKPSVLGPSLISLLFPGIVLGILVWVNGPDSKFAHGFGPFLLTGTIGALAALLPLELVSTYYSERVSGTLLRVRTLPHGGLAWSIGRALTHLTTLTITQTGVLVVVLVSFPSLGIGPAQVALTAAVALLASMACAPIGFILGSLVRNVYGMMLSMAVILGLFATSGAFIPLSAMPTWVGVLQALLPFRWASELTRWALLGAAEPAVTASAANVSVSVGAHPLLCVAILAAWAVIGFPVAAQVVRRGFRAETLSTLEKVRSTLRAQSGL
ncbi:ABC transporter permease [Schaalia sp. 19OD2882]|uniref:ABC transporter permease n=1 Tax=Schaalia sp. 19OD2882 TaxID=2794089 RepID=UPI001C1F0D9E|nr:ABC transporter permease [Schaalia sp. 19OD2882]QWW19306.1 ABC transporter permease [Schaalia sp. 19OD2882]